MSIQSNVWRLSVRKLFRFMLDFIAETCFEAPSQTTIIHAGENTRRISQKLLILIFCSLRSIYHLLNEILKSWQVLFAWY